MLNLQNESAPLATKQWQALLEQWLSEHPVGKRVLLIPPDYSRCFSCAGDIASYLYQRLCGAHVVRVLPAVGTHRQMTRTEQESFFPGVPPEAFLEHHWQTDVAKLGTVPSEYVSKVSNGLYTQEIDVQANRMLSNGDFDDILSIGQVVPHEVVGFANYSKNILVGLGGRNMINHSHMLGAIYGIEKTLGNMDTPVRDVFDFAQMHYLNRLNITFFLTVTTQERGKAELHGLFIDKERAAFIKACGLSQRMNITHVESRIPKVVAYLNQSEFHSTWVGNKAIYRTRMAVADHGELLIIAPGIRQFGENPEADSNIRRWGYCGTEAVMHLYQKNEFENLEMVAAHLIHGSTDGRFTVTYATNPALLSEREVRNAGFQWMDAKDAMGLYHPEQMETGFQHGNEYYFVKNPAVGLWSASADNIAHSSCDTDKYFS